MNTPANPHRPTHDRLQSVEARMDETARHCATLSRTVLALLRRIFRRCQGHPVNTHSRQMTPEEAIEFHARMRAHGVAGRKGSSVNEVPNRAIR